jgi:MFS family permease
LTKVDSASGFYIFAVFSGLSHGGMIVQFGPMLADFYGRPHLASIMGVFQAFTGIGWALGSWFGGYIFDITKSYHSAFLVGVLTYVVAIVLLLFLKKPKPKFCTSGAKSN